jgi:hypothetical protein
VATLGEPVAGTDIYRALAAPDYDPDIETWEFPPGSLVRCVAEIENGEDILAARQLVSDFGHM